MNYTVNKINLFPLSVRKNFLCIISASYLTGFLDIPIYLLDELRIKDFSILSQKINYRTKSACEEKCYSLPFTDALRK